MKTKSAIALKAARKRNRRKARYIISAYTTDSLGKFAYPLAQVVQ